MSDSTTRSNGKSCPQKSEGNAVVIYWEKSKNTLHIDHFRKRELFNTDTDVFDWNNFIVDEKNMEYGADAKDGKNGVKSREEYAMIVNPVEEDPHHYFQYMMADGCIMPSHGLDGAEKEKAQHTIDIFNLNHPALCSLRKDRMRQVKELKDGNMTAGEIVEILQDYGFPSVVEYFCLPRVFMTL